MLLLLLCFFCFCCCCVVTMGVVPLYCEQQSLAGHSCSGLLLFFSRELFFILLIILIYLTVRSFSASIVPWAVHCLLVTRSHTCIRLIWFHVRLDNRYSHDGSPAFRCYIYLFVCILVCIVARFDPLLYS